MHHQRCQAFAKFGILWAMGTNLVFKDLIELATQNSSLFNPCHASLKS